MGSKSSLAGFLRSHGLRLDLRSIQGSRRVLGIPPGCFFCPGNTLRCIRAHTAFEATPFSTLFIFSEKLQKESNPCWGYSNMQSVLGAATQESPRRSRTKSAELMVNQAPGASMRSHSSNHLQASDSLRLTRKTCAFAHSKKGKTRENTTTI